MDALYRWGLERTVMLYGKMAGLGGVVQSLTGILLDAGVLGKRMRNG